MASHTSSITSTTSGSSRRGMTPVKGVALAKKRRAAAAAKSTRATLERVLGLNCHSSLALSSSDSHIAYPAGQVAVLQEFKRKNKQFHVFAKKPISCLELSPDGNYLATGEYGRDPCACVWDLKDKENGLLVSLKGHNFGIQCVAFSTGQKYLVTVGYRFDRQIFVWNWKTGTQLFYGKFGQQVNCLSFSENHTNKSGSNYFVTGHPRRIQFWFFDPPSKDAARKHAQTNVLKARSAILGDLQDNEFVGVACGIGPLADNTYALSKSGKLVLLGRARVVEKLTEIKAEPAMCMVMGENYLFCGCANGIIRLFDTYTLDYIVTLPYPHTLGVDIAAPVISESEELYPDAVAIDISNHKLSVVYNDHSFYVWDVSNVREVKKSRSSLFHSACVWDICTYPFFEDESRQMLPDSSFMTCSSDNTIRFWCLDAHTDQWNIRNIYSKELIRVIYNEDMDYTTLKDSSLLPGDASAVADVTRGVRSIAIHCNGQHLATGDREGNLRIYDLQFMDKIYEEVAHDSEVLQLSYSRDMDGIQFLASASRDRMVHVFSNSEDTYQPIQSLPDHSAAVTAVSFTEQDGNLLLLSAGADKSIIFHALEVDEEGSPALIRFHQVATKFSIYDLTVDRLHKFFFTVGQDKYIRMYGVSTGKKHTVIKVPTSEEASVIKVAIDPSGLYLAASVTDKSVVIIDMYMGECLAKLTGHSEVITQLVFSRDCKYLYTVSGDSCIFVWSLWPELVKNMHDRLAELHQTIPGQLSRKAEVSTGGGVEHVDEGVALSSDTLLEELLEPTQPDFDFRLSMLPVWARKAALARPSMARHATSRGTRSVGSTRHAPSIGSRAAEGRWAERMTNSEMTFASEIETDSLMGYTEGDTDEVTDELPAEQKSDCEAVPVVIDLTEESEQERALETPESPDPPTEESPDLTRTISSGDSDIEADTFYHPTSSHHLNVDPNIFSVTTPTKPISPVADADDDEDSSSVTPNVSPPLKQREELFVEANYQSLERVDQTEDNERKLKAFNSRLSISAKFHEKSRMQLLAADSVRSSSPNLSESKESGLVQIGSAEVGATEVDPIGAGDSEVDPGEADSIGAAEVDSIGAGGVEPIGAGGVEPIGAGEVEPIGAGEVDSIGAGEGEVDMDPDVTLVATATCTADDQQDEPVRTEGCISQTDSFLVRKEETVTMAEDDAAESMPEVSGVEFEPPVSLKKRNSFEEAVSETKKRLQELGYNILPSKEKDASNPQLIEDLAATSRLGENSKDSSRASGIEKAREIEPLEDLGTGATVSTASSGTDATSSRTEPKTLAARTNEVFLSLDASFKTLTALNAEALRTNDSQAISTISKGTAAHKVKVVSWSSKNRKLWRRKGKSTRTASADSLLSAASLGEYSEGEEALKEGLSRKELKQANELLDKLKKLLS